MSKASHDGRVTPARTAAAVSTVLALVGVIIGVVASIIAAFFYVRVVVLMYFADPTEETASVVIPSAFTTITLTAATVMTIALGVFPQWLLDIIEQAGVFIR